MLKKINSAIICVAIISLLFAASAGACDPPPECPPAVAVAPPAPAPLPPVVAQPVPSVDVQSVVETNVDGYLAKCADFVNPAVKNEIMNEAQRLQNEFTVPVNLGDSPDQRDARNNVQMQKNAELNNLIAQKINPYFDGADDKIDGMLSAAQPFEEKNSSLLAYFGHVNEFHQFFLEDMVDDPNRFNVNDYMSDYDALKDSIVAQLQNCNGCNENQDGETPVVGLANFNPADFLDRAIVPPSETGIKFTILNPVDIDPRLNTTIVDMLNALRSKFSNDTTLTAHLDSFIGNFPASSENILMDGAESNVFNTLGSTSGSGSNFVINEFGAMVPSEAGSTSGVVSAGSREHARFNNRSFGYRLRDGQHPSIQVQLGNTTYKLHDTVFTSPIVLDLDGDGKIEASNGEWLPHAYNNSRVVEFDIDGDQFVEITEWVGPNDGLLISIEKGQAVSAHNLFGEAGGFVDGYEKLSVLDADKNNILADEELATLSVWQDKNVNAKIDAGELMSVADLKIESINIDHDDQFKASFMQNGEQRTVWDWYPAYFNVKKKK